MKLTEKEQQKIAEQFPVGETEFYHQDLDEVNIDDAEEWIKSDELVAIVSETNGGIIGYIHRELADDYVNVLNLRAAEKKEREKNINRVKKIQKRDHF